MIALPAIVVVGLVLALTAGGSGEETQQPQSDPAAATATRADRFDSARAWKHLTYQLSLGPRPAGSPQLAKLAEYLRARLPRGRTEPVPGHPGLRNVVGRIPGRKPAVVLAAHYDTKDLPGFVGANDGAGGRRAQRARPDSPRGRPRALRRPARGGDLQRLGREWSSP